MRILSIDYGEARTGFAITDELQITAQGLETVKTEGNDKIILKKIDELLKIYDISTIVVGMPYNLNGTKSERAIITEKFIHKLKCKYPNKTIEIVDERLTTVQAHRDMNAMNINKDRKKQIVDTISAQYILEVYMNKKKLS